MTSGLPTYYTKYSKKTKLKDQINQTLEWLDLPQDERPATINTYLYQPDKAGHKFGPDSQKVIPLIFLI